MSAPGTYNFDLYIGDSWPAGPPGAELLVTVNYQGSPLDLTGATVTAQLRQVKDDIDAAGDFTVDVKDQVANTGQLGLKLTATATALLDARQYHWDLQLNWPTGENMTALAGLANAVRDVTR